MKKIYTLLIMALCCQVNAQTVSPSVIASSGGFASGASGQLSYTTGEMTMVQTINGAGNYLTQGFQQPFDFNVAVEELTSEDNNANVFPNPGNGLFEMDLFALKTATGVLKVYDNLGQCVLQKNINIETGDQKFKIDLSGFSNGIYLFEALNIYDNKSYSKKIQLIH
ncbi:MAG: T9SS type A sorting domain-containing protein [Bacteroidota bacterium]